MSIVAVVLALIAAFFFGLAVVLQQRGAVDLPPMSIREPRSLLRLAKQKAWLLGTVALFVGFAVQAAALDRGQIVIIQPLLATTILFALPLGWLLSGQTIHRREVLSSVAVIIGLALFVIAGDPAGGRQDAPMIEWLLAVAVVVGICVLLVRFGTRGGAVQRAAAYGATAGLLFGLTASLTKPLVEELHVDFAGVLLDWRLYVLLIGGVLAFAYQQISLGIGKLAPSVATVSILNPMLAIILGIVLLEERLSRPAWHVAVALIGLLVGLGGTLVIALGREDDPGGSQGEDPSASATTPDAVPDEGAAR